MEHGLALTETKTNLRKKNSVNQTIGHKRTGMRLKNAVSTIKIQQSSKREPERVPDHGERRDTQASATPPDSSACSSILGKTGGIRSNPARVVQKTRFAKNFPLPYLLPCIAGFNT